MDKKTRNQIQSIIDDVDDLTIATIRSDGFPQATTVSYVNDGMSIYFGTAADAQKAKNIALNDKISATINRSYENWDEIEGISIGGRAIPVTDETEMAKAGQLMLRKFPQISEFIQQEEEPGELAMFRIDPDVISLLDYRKGFGHTELLDAD